MADAKKRPFDVEAWIQFHLLRLAAFHQETTKADLAVLAEIIQRYRGDHGNGWASHEHLGNMAGVSKASVIRAKKNLARLGFVSVVAVGRRGSATVYKPNFELVPLKKGSKDDTVTFGSKDDTETAQHGCPPDTEMPDCGGTDDTPSSLPVPADKAVVRDREDADTAAPSAPLADALGGTAAGAAGFDELYDVFGVRTKRAKARAAYDKLAPGPELHRALVQAAGAWRRAYDEQSRETRYRKQLATWLAGECWLEDPPHPIVVDRKPAADSPCAEAPYLAKIVDFDVPESGEGEIVNAKIRREIAIGDEDEDEMVYDFEMSDPIDVQRLRELAVAVGLEGIPDDSDEMLFKAFTVVPRADSWSLFEPAAAESASTP